MRKDIIANARLGMLLISFTLLWQAALPAATPALDEQKRQPAASASNLERPALQALSDYECDKAILLSVPELLRTARLPLAQPESKKRLARVLTLIGRAFMFDENEPAAAQILQIAHELDPLNPVTVAYLAETMAWLRRLEESDRLYDYLKQHCDGDTVALEALAARALRLSRDEEAKGYLDKAEKLGDKDPSFLMIKSVYLKGQGYISDSADALRSASSLSPQAYNKELFLGLAEAAEGNHQEAAQHFRKAGKALPNEPGWHSKLAVSLTVLGAKDEALTQFKQIASSRRFSNTGLSLLAEYLCFIGKKPEALKCLDYMERVRPWSAMVHTVRGDIYKRTKDNKKAEQELKKALAMDPRKSLTYEFLASLYLGDKKYDLAVKTMKQAVAFIPLSRPCWKKLGDAQSAQGQYVDAAASYRKYFELTSARTEELSPGDKNELASAHAALGLCYYKTNEMAEAVRQAIEFNSLKIIPKPVKFLSWVRLRPERLNFKQPPANTLVGQAVRHAALADMLYETGKLSECCTEYRKAIELQPGNVEWNMCLFSSLMDKGDYGEAIKEDFILATKLMGKAAQTVGKLERKLDPAADKNR